MTAVMIGEENRRVFRAANAALADRVWDKLKRAGAVDFARHRVEYDGVAERNPKQET